MSISRGVSMLFTVFHSKPLLIRFCKSKIASHAWHLKAGVCVAWESSKDTSKVACHWKANVKVSGGTFTTACPHLYANLKQAR